MEVHITTLYVPRPIQLPHRALPPGIWLARTGKASIGMESKIYVRKSRYGQRAARRRTPWCSMPTLTHKHLQSLLPTLPTSSRPPNPTPNPGYMKWRQYQPSVLSTAAFTAARPFNQCRKALVKSKLYFNDFVRCWRVGAIVSAVGYISKARR